MTTLRRFWRVPFYAFGVLVLISAASVGGWRLFIPLIVGVVAGGFYLVSLRIPDWLAARSAREIRRNQEQRRCG